MRERAIGLARGKWPGLLKALGIAADALDGKSHPCPRSGEGVDRFRFTDRGGSGSFFCHCDDHARRGRSGGMRLLMCCKGWTYQEACVEVERIAGNVSPAPRPKRMENSNGNSMDRIKAIARRCVDASDPVVSYLTGRCLVPTAAIRQSREKYWNVVDGKPECIGEFDAMVCSVRAPDGKVHAMHVTYLREGRKAAVPAPRKVIGTIPKGSAIRLFNPGKELGIAEGIETALAAHALYSVPVWACLSATTLEGFEPPEGVEELWIFGDNDSNGAGQIAAYRCKQRLHERGLRAHVVLPMREGEDWNDVLIEARSMGKAA